MLHRVVRTIPLLLVAFACAPPLAGAPAVAQTDAGSQADRSDLEPEPMGFSDALSKAQRLERFLVVLWTRKDDPRTPAHVETILGDPEVRRWVEENAVLASVDVDEHRFEANGNGITARQVPSFDLVKASTGTRLGRLVVGTTATDFLAAVVGHETSGPIERPSGERASEPFRWLAWANHRFHQGDENAGKDATEGYIWLMTTSEAHRPGFRARYLEYLVRRLNLNRRRDVRATEYLGSEVRTLRTLAQSGDASRRDVYELTRIAEWIGESEIIESVYEQLSEPHHDAAVKERRKRIRRWLVSDAVPMLGRNQKYDQILLAFDGPPAETFAQRGRVVLAAEAARSAALEPDQGEGVEPPTFDPEFAPLPNTIPDTRDDVLDDASWVFEALLARDRTDEARALQAAMARTFDGAAPYAHFVNRAMRAENYDLAAELIDLGFAVEPDSKRLKRLQTALTRALRKQ